MLKKTNARLTYIVITCIVLLLSGCANRAVVDKHPTFDLEAIQSIHISNSDGGGDELIPVLTSKLIELGYAVTAGDEVSEGADAILSYRDKWHWDITMYMIELTVTVKDKENDIVLATGNSMHTSLTRLSEKEMVNEVLTNIFCKDK